MYFIVEIDEIKNTEAFVNPVNWMIAKKSDLGMTCQPK